MFKKFDTPLGMVMLTVGPIIIGMILIFLYQTSIKVDRNIRVETEVIGRKVISSSGVFSKGPTMYAVDVKVEGKSVRHKVDPEFYKSLKTGDRVTIVYNSASNGQVCLKDVYRDLSLER